MLVTAAGSSVTSILLLTVERYLSVSHPTAVKQFLTRRKMGSVIVSVWVMWLLYSIPGLLASWDYRSNSSPEKYCFLGDDYYNRYHLITLVILFVAHQIPMWYFQVKTLQIAKLYLRTPMERLRIRGSVQRRQTDDHHNLCAVRFQDMKREMSRSCPSVTEAHNTDALPTSEMTLALPSALQHHRWNSTPLPHKDSNLATSDEVLNKRPSAIRSRVFLSLTNLVSEFGRTTPRRRSSTLSAHKMKRVLKRSHKMSKLVFSVMGCFSLCWWPYISALGLYCICPDHCHITPQVFNVLGILIALNLFCNAFIYAAKSKDFRLAFKNIFRCKRSILETPSVSLPRLNCEHFH